jgi:hypothetical protein
MTRVKHMHTRIKASPKCNARKKAEAVPRVFMQPVAHPNREKQAILRNYR